MRTSENTMLAAMGFRDDDRTDPQRRHLHDQAVRFLMQKEMAAKLWTLAYSGRIRCSDERIESARGWGCEPEMVVKRDNGYVVGFVDLLIMDTQHLYNDEHWNQFDTNRSGYEREAIVSGPVPQRIGKQPYPLKLIVEVKTAIDDPGSVVRQVKLYVDCIGGLGIVVCIIPPDAAAVKIIQSAGIKFVQLSSKFKDWLAQQTEATPDAEL